MTFTYQSGEEIRKGDRVILHGEPGEIEFVVNKIVGDSAMDWYMSEFGGGVMVAEPKVFGRAFLSQSDIDEYLEFVRRGNDEMESS